jgi:hypothetical protein
MPNDRDARVKPEPQGWARRKDAEQWLCRGVNQNLRDEHFRVKVLEKWYETEEMQMDLNTHLHRYYHERSHQSQVMEGKNPYQAFIEELPKKEKTDTPPGTPVSGEYYLCTYYPGKGDNHTKFKTNYLFLFCLLRFLFVILLSISIPLSRGYCSELLVNRGLKCIANSTNCDKAVLRLCSLAE